MIIIIHPSVPDSDNSAQVLVPQAWGYVEFELNRMPGVDCYHAFDAH